MAVDKEKEKMIESQCTDLIHKGRYSDAARLMEKYRTPLHDYWHDGPLHLDRELNEVYKINEIIPDRLRGLSAEHLQTARKALIYMLFRGNNTIMKYWNKPTNVPNITIGIAMKIMMNRADQLQQIEDYKKSHVVTDVEIIDAKGDLCPECKKLCGTYDLFGNIPVLPNPRCLNADPCLPLMTAVTGIKDKPKKKGFFGLFG